MGDQLPGYLRESPLASVPRAAPGGPPEAGPVWALDAPYVVVPAPGAPACPPPYRILACAVGRTDTLALWGGPGWTLAAEALRGVDEALRAAQGR